MQYNKVKALIAENKVQKHFLDNNSYQSKASANYFDWSFWLLPRGTRRGPVLPVLKYTDISDAIARTASLV